MAINIGDSSINSIYRGDTKVSAIYLGYELVYGKRPVSYNIFVFHVGGSYGYTIYLQNNRRGDTTDWDGLTDWGDGTVDTKLSHTYSESGDYTVKTKWSITSGTNSDNYTRGMFTKCLGINRYMTDYSYLFYNCLNLTEVVFGSEIKNINDLESAFFDCSSLTSLDLSSIRTDNVITMNAAFYGCSKLIKLDIRNFNMDNTYRYENMFFQSKKLKTIITTNCNNATKQKIQEARNYAGI